MEPNLPKYSIKRCTKYGYINYPHYDWTTNTLIETSDGAFALAGGWQETGSVSYYYLVKTVQALPPPPTPTHIPTPPPNPTQPNGFLGLDVAWLALLAVAIIAIAVFVIVLLRRRRKQ